MLTVLIILTITILLFIWGKLPPDMIALMAMISLFITGILDLQETLSGFSNPTVIMIAALFIIGEGLSHTGWTALAGRKFVQWAGNSISKLLLILSFGSGFLSGFVSNTGTVATLLPVTVSAAWSIGSLPSKFLMPVAFGSNTGGLLTLTGTPPNIIASDALEASGAGSLGFFEISLIGFPLLVVALLYFYFIGYRLLPDKETSNRPIDIDSEVNKWIEAYRIDSNYNRLRIRSMSPMINTKIGDWDLEEDYNVSIIRLKRRHPNILDGTKPFVEFPSQETVLKYHDIITVKGAPIDIDRLMTNMSLGLLPLGEINQELKTNLINQEVGMSEVIVTPKSRLVGRQIVLGDYFDQFDIQVLAASRNNIPWKERAIKVKAGDAFLLRSSWGNLIRLKKVHQNLVICGSPESMAKNVDNLTFKSFIALTSLLLMIILLVVKLLPGAIAAMLCAGIILLTGCVPITKAYKGISWSSVVMIAAMIPMGLALQKTGAAQLAADSLVKYLGTISPLYLLGGVFLLTSAFSQTINNSATAVLMAPITILAASSLGVSPVPFLVVVAISASTAFLTPVGTTTNAMVMAAGGYKFVDYLKVGTPLLLIFFLLSMILVPIIWPF